MFSIESHVRYVNQAGEGSIVTETSAGAVPNARIPEQTPPAPLIVVRQASKCYPDPSGGFTALRQVDLEVGVGEFVAVAGKSGSGKTTLLNLLAGIDRPSAGSVTIAGTRLEQLSESALAEWRGRTIGLVFQFFQLLPTLTVLENVMLPMEFSNTVPPGARRLRALELLDRVGISAHADKLPATLSGGEQQRSAIARALANDPPLLLADEPTGNLDSATTASVLELFTILHREGRTILVVTHEAEVRAVADRCVTLHDGRIVSDERVEAPAWRA
jgi:putative ABC transport system ATP-binding protein